MLTDPHRLALPLLLSLLVACGGEGDDADKKPRLDVDQGEDQGVSPDLGAPDAAPDLGAPDLDAPDQDTPDAAPDAEPDLPVDEPDAAPDMALPPAPAAAILSPAAGDVTRRFEVPVIIEATSEAALTLTLALNGGAPQPIDLASAALGAGRWRVSVTPALGVNRAEITATDVHGQSAAASVTFTYGAPVAAGGAHTGAIRPAGLMSWGRNNKGQIGNAATSATPTPTPTLIAGPPSPAWITYNQNASVALGQDGSVWAWGDGAKGQLCLGASTDGTLDVADRSAPAQVQGFNAVAAARGYRHTLLLKADGTVWACGDNSDGQLGDGTTTDRDRPTQVTGLTDVVVIGAGSGSSLALRRDGTLWAWGDNSQGQLGGGADDTDPHSVPTQVPGLTDVFDVAAGKDHVLAITSQGALWAWGLNQSGQVGDGSSGADADVFAPKAITLPAPARAIFANANYSFAIVEGGAVYGWGQNFNGQLGLGMADTTEQPAPVLAAAGLVDAVWFALGATHAIAQTRTGGVWSWGWHFMGALGHPALEDRWTQTSPLELTFP